MKRIGFCLISIVIVFLFVLSCTSTESNSGGSTPLNIVLPDIDVLAGYNLTEEFHIYIAFGQSNMQGPAEIRAQDRTGVSERFRIMNVVAGGYAGGYREKHLFYRAVPPLIIPDRNLVNHLGLNIGLSPVDYFGRTLTQNTPENITIGVIAAANGDMALAAFHKTKADNYYKRVGTLDGRPSPTEIQGMNRYRSAGYASIYEAIVINAKLAQRAGGTVKGIIVHQGESGVGLRDTNWLALLKEIYDDMLSDLGLAPNSIPVLLGQTWNGGSGLTSGALANDRVIQAVVPNAWIISSVGATGRTGQGQPDNIHFGSAGIELLGRRYAEKMIELVYRQN